MPNLDYKLSYRKNLPHIQPLGATFFVTCRLAGSLPRIVLEELQERETRAEKIILATAAAAERDRLLYREKRRAFGCFDSTLDRAATGPTWLKQPEIAAIILESLHFLNRQYYDLDVFCVMSNHIHAVFSPLRQENGEYVALQRILHSLKRYTAREANKHLQRSGSFWQRESYDHFVRDERELNRIRKYVLNNPVKAGLVDEAEKWPYSWAHWF